MDVSKDNSQFKKDTLKASTHDHPAMKLNMKNPKAFILTCMNCIVMALFPTPAINIGHLL